MRILTAAVVTLALSGGALAECQAGREAVLVGMSDRGPIELRYDDGFSGVRVTTAQGTERFRKDVPLGTGIPGRVYVSLSNPAITTAMIPGESENEAYWNGFLVTEECRLAAEDVSPEWAVDQ
jgi:hypothetical protein